MQREIMEHEDMLPQTIDIITQERTKDLKPYKFNEELFDLLKGSDYEALKRDVEKNGVKVELHILPDKTVICGHQRLKIAGDLGIKHLRCKTVIGLETEEQIKEYVILDNLLRRHLSREKRAILHNELYEIKKKPQLRGTDGQFLPTGEDVYQEIANQTNNKRRTVVNDIQYIKAIKNNPEKYKDMKISTVLMDLKIEKQKEEIKKGLEKPDGFFDIIVIDPPWKYNREYNDETSRVASKYPEMELKELKELELPTKKDCILWLWTTHKFIWDARQILEKWGFEYKAVLIWDKEKMGIGKYLRLQCEFCLIGFKGKPLWENKNIRDIIREPRTGHSVKPESFFKMIDDNFIGRKLDYFGRKKRDGWEVFGVIENA